MFKNCIYYFIQLHYCALVVYKALCYLLSFNPTDSPMIYLKIQFNLIFINILICEFIYIGRKNTLNLSLIGVIISIFKLLYLLLNFSYSENILLF